MILLAVLLSVLLDVESTDRPTPKKSVETTKSKGKVLDDNRPSRVSEQRIERRPTPLPKAGTEQSPRQPSESELLGEEGVSAPQPDYPAKPEIPDYDMPEGPQIMSFDYQRLHFKNMPEDRRMGLALYVKVRDVDQRKYAYLQHLFGRLTTPLASSYGTRRSDRVGQTSFLKMLRVRFARRLKGNQLVELKTAFFEG